MGRPVLSDPTTLTGDATAQIQAAQTAFGQGRVAEAAALCERILSADAEHADALFLQGLCARQSGDLARAETSLRRAATVTREAPAVLNALGLVLGDRGQHEAAVALYRRALAANPDYAKAHNNLGNALKDLGQTLESLAHYERAIALEPRYAEAYYNMGSALDALERHEPAVAAYRQCLALAPNVIEAQVKLGLALEALGRLHEAYEAQTRAAALRPEAPEIQALLGDLSLKRGDLETARTHYDRAFAAGRDERYRRGFRRLAKAHAERGDYETASRTLLEPLRSIAGGSAPPSMAAGSGLKTSATKLRHTEEQLTDLMARGDLPLSFQDPRDACREALAGWTDDDSNHLATLPADLAARIAPVDSRLLHFRATPAVGGGAVNPSLDAAAIERAFAEAKPGMARIDGLLTEPALAALQAFCRDSTIWWQLEHTHEIGSSLINGFCCPLVLQIATELRQALPGLLGAHPFATVWAYKYYPPLSGGENPSSGLDVHADDGALSLNFWITPDEANLDPEGGGMTFWDAMAPGAYFNTGSRMERLAIVEPLHAAAGAPVARYPHRCNSGVLFRSNTLHRSDQYRFRDDYASRRISITMTFGRRDDGTPP